MVWLSRRVRIGPPLASQAGLEGLPKWGREAVTSDDAEGGSPLDRGGAGGDAQLHVDPAEMGFDGVVRQVELGGHVGVGQELGERFEYS